MISLGLYIITKQVGITKQVHLHYQSELKAHIDLSFAALSTHFAVALTLLWNLFIAFAYTHH